MEKKLFSWDSWDQGDTAYFTFYNVVLKVQIGAFAPGTAFDCACLNYENGNLTFYDYNTSEESQSEMGSFELELGVKQNGKEI